MKNPMMQNNIFAQLKKYNMKKILFTILMFLCISCVNENENVATIKVTLEEIKQNPNFSWFDKDYDSYPVNSNAIQDIKDNFDSINHKIIIFTAWDCLCGKEYLKFPYFIKILDSANISEKNYEIFIMGTIESQHPYSALFKVAKIPSFNILYDGHFVYSVNDTAIKYSKTLEPALLEGLKTKPSLLAD